MRLVIALVFILIALPAVSLAQEVKNIIVRLDNDKLIVNYDLEGESQESYLVTLFSSHDNFENPVKSVSGDIGEEIKPGMKREVVWMAAEDLMGFSGNLQVKVRAQWVPLIEFNIPNKFKRGKSYEVKWKSNSSTPTLNFNLANSEKVIEQMGRVENDGSWIWKVPIKQKVGKNFQLTAISINRKAQSSSFRISRKIPLMIKLLPIIGGFGGIIAIIIPKEEQAQPIVLPLKPN